MPKVKAPGVVTGRYGTLGQVFYVEQDFWPLNTSLYVSDFKGNNPRYISYFLKTLNFGGQNAAGAVPGVNRNHLHMLDVWLPPIADQVNIASILAAYDGLIENCERRILVLEKMARSLYREWFVCMRYPGHENFKGVLQPPGWKVLPLEEIVAEHIGGGWGQDERSEQFSDGGWVIRGADIPEARSGGVSRVPYRFHKPSNMSSRLLAPLDIVFEVSGGTKDQPVGRTLLVLETLLQSLGGRTICASFCKKVRANTGILDPYLLYFSFLEGYENGEIVKYQVQSTGLSNFKWTEYLAGVSRNVPPAKIQVAFRTIVEPWLILQGVLGQQAGNLKKTRDLLLARMFDARHIVGDLK
jgi:type I restriction enzyme S subunit